MPLKYTRTLPHVRIRKTFERCLRFAEDIGRLEIAIGTVRRAAETDVGRGGFFDLFFAFCLSTSTQGGEESEPSAIAGWQGGARSLYIEISLVFHSSKAMKTKEFLVLSRATDFFVHPDCTCRQSTHTIEIGSISFCSIHSAAVCPFFFSSLALLVSSSNHWILKIGVVRHVVAFFSLDKRTLWVWCLRGRVIDIFGSYLEVIDWHSLEFVFSRWTFPNFDRKKRNWSDGRTCGHQRQSLSEF